MLRFAGFFYSVCGLFCSYSLTVVAQQTLEQTTEAERERRFADVSVITSPLAIDGQLDEETWASAPVIGELVQQQPATGQAPSERTEVKLLRDGDYLYVGVMALDSEPHRVIGTTMARDGSLTADDRIEIVLDTYRDRRNAFYFATNPSGALVDGLVFANGGLNTDWDAIWQVRAQRNDAGWVAEFAIPFKSLSFPVGRDNWGFNISRTIYRKQEEARWTGARLETAFFHVSEAGTISELRGLSQGIGLDVRPFAAGRWVDLRSGRRSSDGNPGLDVFYNVTPSLKLTGTLNTDFGEAEVDARQINLNRYSLLFPEKRSFFLEDAGVFTFSSTGPDPQGGVPETGNDVFPFFSRRIGLLAGQEVPIDAGLKLAGKAGRTDIGLLGVRTGESHLAEQKDFLVGRVRQNLLEQSYIGAIFTDGSPIPGQSGRTYGMDVRLATSRFMNMSRNFILNGYATRSEAEDDIGSDWSYGLSAHYPNDKINLQMIVREVQKNFDPALGFVQRRNVRMYRAGAGYNPRPENFLGLQQMLHAVYYTRFERADTGELESWNLYIKPVDWHFRSGDSIHALVDINPSYERLFEPFEISPGVVLPVGEYRFTRFRSSWATAAKRPISASMNLQWGDFWSGTAEQVTASITYKLPPWMTLTTKADQTFAHLPEGNFIVRLLTADLDVAASPSLSWSNRIQYDNRSRNLNWQARLRYTLQPGQDVFLVFNQGWIQEDLGDLRFRTEDRKISAKVQYTFRF